MSLTDLEIRQHTQPIEAELNKQKEKNGIIKKAAEELFKALKDQVDAFDKQVAEYRATDSEAIAQIAEQVHGARMSRSRAALKAWRERGQG